MCSIFALAFLDMFIKNKKYSKFIQWIMLIIIIVLSALRYDVGFDYPTYFTLASSNNSAILFEEPAQRMELIPKAFIYISIKLNNPYIFFIISSVWIVIFFYKGIKIYNIKTSYSLFVFSLYPIFFINSFSTIRQFMALKKDRKRYIFGFIISYLCHRTSIILLLILPMIYIIHKVKRERTNIYKCLLFIVVLLFFLNELISQILAPLLNQMLTSIGLSYYTVFLQKDVTRGGERIIYLNLLISVILVIFLKKMKFNNIFLITSIFFLLGVTLEVLLTPYGHIGVRLGQYYLIYLTIVIPAIIESSSGLKKIILFLLVSYTIMLLFSYTLYLDWFNFKNGITIKSQYFPYTSIFFR